MTWPTPVANANAAAEWPEGNDVEIGIGTCRAIGTSWATRSGRRRLPSGLTTRFTNVAVTPTDASPSAAARRPRRPPATDSSPAAASEIFE